MSSVFTVLLAILLSVATAHASEDSDAGFQLSAEAFKNFDLKLQKLLGKGPWSVPKSAVVRSAEEVNLFRMRDGFFKRIDFREVKKSGSMLTVATEDLREGDQIVVSGLGFLRIAELAATGGAAHGHSH